jgi:hypothetical protein
MSSSPTVPTSTTSSSSSSRSDRIVRDVPGVHTGVSGPVSSRTIPSGRVALVACGALAQPAAEIAGRRGWPVDVHPLPPLLHNQPQKIAGEVRALARSLLPSYDKVVVGYADCGTYGALDEVCADLGLERLPGLHCYDVFGGASRLEGFFEEQPGTYVFTDFLVRSFARTVERELGLDRWPELRDAYFGSYTRVVWLAQEPDEELHALAAQAAERIGLPLTVVETGHGGLEQALADLVGQETGPRADQRADQRTR